jgi:hypothetical protein
MIGLPAKLSPIMIDRFCFPYDQTDNEGGQLQEHANSKIIGVVIISQFPASRNKEQKPV